MKLQKDGLSVVADADTADLLISMGWVQVDKPASTPLKNEDVEGVEADKEEKPKAKRTYNRRK